MKQVSQNAERVSRTRGDSDATAIEGAVAWLSDLRRSRIEGPKLKARPKQAWRLATRAVHSGAYEEPTTGAVGTPIFQASTFRLNAEQYRAFDQGHGRDRFIYTRYGNPSQWAVQEKIAALENAQSALVFSSGMAAIMSAIAALSDPGGHIVASSELYGGTYALFNSDLPNLGRRVTLVDPTDIDAIAASVVSETQILFFEAVTNPLLKVADLPRIAALARAQGCRTIVDATFATPIGVRPLEHGIDVVVHSATKYLNGHSDLVAGVAAGERKLIDQIWARMLTLGGCLDPHACFLLERGLKTLALRMRAHEQGAIRIARHLEAHPRVKRVFYPRLESHPNHVVAKSLFENMGGIVSFEVAGGDEAALRLADLVTLPCQATSLGGVESLISLPFNTSQAGYTARQRGALGIHPGLVRLSVGIEDPEDLIADLDAALAAL
jgi:cystathionine beta-lyase/cystathionine gamma-synthase